MFRFTSENILGNDCFFKTLDLHTKSSNHSIGLTVACEEGSTQHIIVSFEKK